MITSQQMLGLDESHLVDCQQGHKLQATVAPAFLEMQKAAAVDGIDCQIASSYRSFEQQKTIWHKKWLGEKVLRDVNEQILPIETLSAEQKLEAILTWSALPGASRHHWGTDFDVYDQQAVLASGKALKLVQQEYLDPNGPCYALNRWLNQHASQYGFSRPFDHYVGGVAAEPWHLSFHAISNELSGQFDLAALKLALEQTQLLGLELILIKLEEIYFRFILNKGQA